MKPKHLVATKCKAVSSWKNKCLRLPSSQRLMISTSAVPHRNALVFASQSNQQCREPPTAPQMDTPKSTPGSQVDTPPEVHGSGPCWLYQRPPPDVQCPGLGCLYTRACMEPPAQPAPQCRRLPARAALAPPMMLLSGRTTRRSRDPFPLGAPPPTPSSPSTLSPATSR
eukprot:CAMPEP_0114286470 /NCGR_PEP_ID=MMETSP0059-20121206/5771_1 /TAXON_ID=36894 /ORGANISM="Pyramimonas parkeae, Strain CCMP726" /LENGTH=168 /DNA_ID=CAMNT_0001407505 /DNA_START=166 /DNA_END=672 /DNA_ORIENTATION=+